MEVYPFGQNGHRVRGPVVSWSDIAPARTLHLPLVERVVLDYLFK